MDEKEVIFTASALLLAFLSILVFSLKVDLEENVLILGLLPIGLSLAVLPKVRQEDREIKLTKILQYKKWLGVFIFIILLLLILFIFPWVIDILVNSGPQYLLNGIIIGSILSLGGIGLTIVYKILGFPNFAHGDILTFGAYIVLFLNLSFNLPLVFSLIGAIGLGCLLVTVLEKSLWKPLRDKGAGKVTMLIASIGLALFLRNFILFLFGGSNKAYNLPVSKGIEFQGIVFTKYELLVVMAAFILMFLVYFLLTRTKLGKSMRALADNKNLARISGIDVDRVILGTWIIGVSLAVIAGFFYGLITSIRPNMGWYLLLPLFAAVIVGGIGNPYGAMLGGMVVGISMELSILFLPVAYRSAIPFVLIIIILLWKPEGLLGG